MTDRLIGLALIQSDAQQKNSGKGLMQRATALNSRQALQLYMVVRHRVG